MERSDLPDKLFADDTLSYPNSVDGERPAAADRQSSMQQGERRHEASPADSPGEEMLAVEYREDEVQTAASPLEHTPSPEDLYEPGGGNPSPGADIEDEAPPDRGGRTY